MGCSPAKMCKNAYFSTKCCQIVEGIHTLSTKTASKTVPHKPFQFVPFCSHKSYLSFKFCHKILRGWFCVIAPKFCTVSSFFRRHKFRAFRWHGRLIKSKQFFLPLDPDCFSDPRIWLHRGFTSNLFGSSRPFSRGAPLLSHLDSVQYCADGPEAW